METVWIRLVDFCAEALRMTREEKSSFLASKVARLVGLLPFLAGCEEPERTALAHLGTWVLANRGEARRVFDHKPADDADPLSRLAPIADFRGGDRAVIEAGMRRMALCMVAGYARDREKDRASGEYNPLNAGTWEAGKTLAALGAPAEPTLPGNVMAEAAPPAQIPTPAKNAGVEDILRAAEAVRIFWER